MMNLDAALQTFQEESTELLEEVEEVLLDIDTSDNNKEAIDALFRAIHTIKGTSGIFGFDRLVDLTHVSESLLDILRHSDAKISNTEVELFLQCKDLVHTMVDAEVNNKALTDEVESKISEVIQRFEELLGDTDLGKSDSADVQNSEGSNDESEAVSYIDEEADKNIENDNWHLSLRFNHDVLANGMDPASFIKYLRKLGDIVSIETLIDKIPSLEDLEVEDCYLGFEIRFDSKSNRDDILEVFEFVKQDADITLIPPNAKISEYIKLINNLDEDDDRIGEILVNCGALSADELEEALYLQEQHHENNQNVQIGEVLVDEQFVSGSVVNAALNKQDSIRSKSKVVRIDTHKLDGLIDLVGEMVITGATAHLQAQKTGDEALLQIMYDLERLVEEIRDTALHLRMVQIGHTFNKFKRVVRDVGQQLNKDIGLTISGGETELDKTYVDKLNDPLMHLIRNAIDHGIEMPEERMKKGKSEKGQVKLNAFHDSGNVVIEISDDGAGLNRETILNKAREKNLIGQHAELTDHEIFSQIFSAGFSTASEVTDISGRGVGMDVVKQNIEDLRGTIEVDSVVDQGTTFSIRLPLTLAIIDGFLISVATSSYVLPLDTIVECIELDELAQQRIRHQNYINLRDEMLPCIHLRKLFGFDEDSNERQSIVVVHSGHHRAGLVVDDLLGEFQTVIKPIGSIFENLDIISGSTILGSGEVAIILNVNGILSGMVSDEDDIEELSKHIDSVENINPSQVRNIRG